MTGSPPAPKRLILAGRRGPSAARGLLYHPDGTVTVPRPPRAQAPLLRCLACQHLHWSECQMGFERACCVQRRLLNSRGELRRFSRHELENPSRELLTVARGCPDHWPAAAAS